MPDLYDLSFNRDFTVIRATLRFEKRRHFSINLQKLSVFYRSFSNQSGALTATNGPCHTTHFSARFLWRIRKRVNPVVIQSAPLYRQWGNVGTCHSKVAWTALVEPTKEGIGSHQETWSRRWWSAFWDHIHCKVYPTALNTCSLGGGVIRHTDMCLQTCPRRRYPSINMYHMIWCHKIWIHIVLRSVHKQKAATSPVDTIFTWQRTWDTGHTKPLFWNSQTSSLEGSRTRFRQHSLRKSKPSARMRV